jgi:uncharacterized OB-fold protein
VRPRPTPSTITQPFWEATAQGRFLIQRCQRCQHATFYPKPTCPNCGFTELNWEDASGRATVHTFSIARRATHPAFAGQEPYVVGIVELEEGPLVTTNIVECAPEDVRIGMPVELTFEDVGDDGIALPLFRPAPATS